MKGNDEKRRGIYLGIWNGIHFELVELLITGRKPPLCSLFILKLKNLILTRNLRFFVEEKYLFPQLSNPDVSSRMPCQSGTWKI